jgi:hypothetical protein
MINEEKSYSIMDNKEADPILEKHRKDVIEKYIEYEIAFLQDFRGEGNTLDDYIEHLKTILWFVKDQRAHFIKEELGV